MASEPVTSSAPLSYDVVVMGGAVAGASTAILLKRGPPGSEDPRRREDRPLRLEGRRIDGRGLRLFPDAGPQAVRPPLSGAAPQAGLPVLVRQRQGDVPAGGLGDRADPARAHPFVPARPLEARRAPAPRRRAKKGARSGGRRRSPPSSSAARRATRSRSRRATAPATRSAASGSWTRPGGRRSSRASAAASRRSRRTRPRRSGCATAACATWTASTWPAPIPGIPGRAPS